MVRTVKKGVDLGKVESQFERRQHLNIGGI